MLYARRGGGFDITDLISAFEGEVTRMSAEFVRHWMKRPGVPQDFRSRYEGANAARLTIQMLSIPKETTP